MFLLLSWCFYKDFFTTYSSASSVCILMVLCLRDHAQICGSGWPVDQLLVLHLWPHIWCNFFILKSSQARWPKDKISNVLSIHFIPWKWRKNERSRTPSFAKLSLGHAQYDWFFALSFGKIERACWKWLQSKLNRERGQRRQLTNNLIMSSKQSNSFSIFSSWKCCLGEIN